MGISSVTANTGGFSALVRKTTLTYSSAGTPDFTTEPDSFASEQAKLDQYTSDRETLMKAAFGNTPPDTVTVAMPVDAHGRTPFVTADQQRIMDSVTDQYMGQNNFAGLMDKLTQLGVNPDQIRDNAQYFLGKGGQVTDRYGNPVSGALVDVMA